MAIKHLENFAFRIPKIDKQHGELSRAYDKFCDKEWQDQELEAVEELI
jgi:hypothetical protein